MRLKSLTCDVLVIGAGAAGIRAAVAACRAGTGVVLLAQKPPGQAGSSFSPQSPHLGIQALVDAERTPESLEAFYDDVIRVGLGCAEPELARILVEESGPRFEDLRAFGIRFKRDAKGRYLRVAGCFSRTPRAFVTANQANFKRSLASVVQGPPVGVIQFVTGRALALMVSDQICGGTWGLTNDGRVAKIRAKATVLATGGGAGLFCHHLVSDFEAGQGYALAHEAGADLANLEFIQFMLGFYKAGRPSFLPLNTLDQPEMLISQDGRDLLAEHIPDAFQRAQAVAARNTHFPFSSRDSSVRVDMAVARKNESGQPVLWKDPDDRQAAYEVVHFAHAFNGGVKINEQAQTSLDGLYAAGEVAAGPHGADRIGGCMITATQVFGQRAGCFAAQRAQTMEHLPEEGSLPEPIAQIGAAKAMPAHKMQEMAAVLEPVRNLFSRHVGVRRHPKKLQKVLGRIMQARREAKTVSSLGALERFDLNHRLLVMQLVTEAALNRTTSLGSHFVAKVPLTETPTQKRA